MLMVQALNDVIGLNLRCQRKDAEREAAEIEPRVEPSVETMTPPRECLEDQARSFRSESDNLETHDSMSRSSGYG